MRPVTERLSPTVTVFVVLSALMFAFYGVVKHPAARMFVEAHLALSPAAVLSGEVWQLVTALFVHLDGFPFFLDMVGLWWVGATLERDMGRRKFLVLFFVPAVVANAVMVLLSIRFGSDGLYPGCSLAVLGLFLAFGKIYNRTPVRVFGALVLEARFLVAILVGFSLLADIARHSLVALVGDIVALTLAYLLVGGRGAGLGSLFDRLRGGKRRRRFQVVEGGKSEDRRANYLN
jgi:membrane associated rhomboid family serine protease